MHITVKLWLVCHQPTATLQCNCHHRTARPTRSAECDNLDVSLLRLGFASGSKQATRSCGATASWDEGACRLPDRDDDAVPPPRSIMLQDCIRFPLKSSAPLNSKQHPSKFARLQHRHCRSAAAAVCFYHHRNRLLSAVAARCMWCTCMCRMEHVQGAKRFPKSRRLQSCCMLRDVRVCRICSQQSAWVHSLAWRTREFTVRACVLPCAANRDCMFFQVLT